nr:alpha carbonic anhydrase 7-like [Ipomoea batatas]
MREFDYSEGSEKGPERWGDLKGEWEACKNGEMQSPIDISHERVEFIRSFEKRHYKPANATVKNRGHDISVSLRIILSGFLHVCHVKHRHLNGFIIFMS